MQKYYKIKIEEFRYDDNLSTKHFLKEVFPTIYLLYEMESQYAISYGIKKSLQKSIKKKLEATNIPSYLIFEVLSKRKNDFIVKELITDLTFNLKSFHLFGNETDEIFCLNYLKELNSSNVLAVFKALHKFINLNKPIIYFPTVNRFISDGKHVLKLKENDTTIINNIIPFKRQ